MHIVGLTGGIASGKSTVSEMFRGLGVPVIDADVLAREVVEPGEPALEEIAEAFGPEVLGEQGRLDREALGQIVFENDEARARLGEITHPRIGQRMWERAEAYSEDGHDWVIYDAALIVEGGLQEAFAALIVVALDEATQLERLMARDGIDEAQARERVASQLPLSEKVAVADHVIDNGSDRERTRAQVERVFAHLERELTEGAGEQE